MSIDHLQTARVETRCCPDCGFIMSQTEIDKLRFDMDCRRCGKRKTSEFQILDRAITNLQEISGWLVK